MTDRELLELAAKAAWIDIVQDPVTLRMRKLEGILAKEEWDPLTDDGDALQLAVGLSMDILKRFVGGRRVECLVPGGPVISEPCGNDAYAATRRAIVRAAAAIASSCAAPPDRSAHNA